MTIRLGDLAPDFEQDSTDGPIRFHEWAGDSWVVLFSHPKDFTPVCTTELGAVAKLKPEFEKRGVKVIGLSVDPLDSHRRWVGDIEETQGAALNFPLLADSDRKVSDLYGMIHPNANDTFTVRSVFVIDPEQEGPPYAHLPGRDGTELRGAAARHRLPAADRQVRRRDARRLEPRRGRHHRPGRHGRAGQSEVSERLEDPEALSSGDAPAGRLIRRSCGLEATTSPRGINQTVRAARALTAGP